MRKEKAAELVGETKQINRRRRRRGLVPCVSSLRFLFTVHPEMGKAVGEDVAELCDPYFHVGSKMSFLDYCKVVIGAKAS